MIDMIKDKKKIIVIVVCALVILIIAVVGFSKCNDSDNSEVSDTVNTEIIQLDDSNMNSAIDKILNGEETAGDPCIATENYIYVNLMCDSYEIIDRYYGDHALFVKVKTTANDVNDYVMVRFQLNNENKISDCITYKIAN